MDNLAAVEGSEESSSEANSKVSKQRDKQLTRIASVDLSSFSVSIELLEEVQYFSYQFFCKSTNCFMFSWIITYLIIWFMHFNIACKKASRLAHATNGCDIRHRVSPTSAAVAPLHDNSYRGRRGRSCSVPRQQSPVSRESRGSHRHVVDSFISRGDGVAICQYRTAYRRKITGQMEKVI